MQPIHFQHGERNGTPQEPKQPAFEIGYNEEVAPPSCRIYQQQQAYISYFKKTFSDHAKNLKK